MVKLKNSKNSDFIYKDKTKENLTNIIVRKFGQVENIYYNQGWKVDYTCGLNHKLTKNVKDIFQGVWCKLCNCRIAEEASRQYLEKIFDNKFPSIRPSWLKSSVTGMNLELDGYCAELNLAFEHQGHHHYLDSYGNLDRVQRNDKLKKEMCDKIGIKLIIIPDLNFFKNENDILDYILEQCDNLKLNTVNRNVSVDQSLIFNSKKLTEFNKILKNIKDQGWSTTNTTYKDRNDIFNLSCVNKHKLTRLATKLSSGSFYCRDCNEQNFSISKYKEICNIVKNKGGICINKEYSKAQDYLTIQCENKHQWQTVFNKLKHGHWCPICADILHSQKIRDKQIFLAKLLQIIKNNEGLLLSEIENLRSDDKFLIKCKIGHEFETKLNNLYKQSWCSKCIKIERFGGIQTFIDIANKYNGTCLTKNYKDSNQIMKFKCEKGHKFKINTGKLLRTEKTAKKYWCPTCGNYEKSLKNRGKKREDVIIKLNTINFTLADSIDNYDIMLGNNNYLNVKCKNNHITKKSVSQIFHEYGCKKCYDLRSG